MSLLDTNQLKLDLANDLIEVQDYDASTAGAILERAVLEAAHWFSRDKDWNFVLAQAAITTVNNTKGPYSLPADFDGKPIERRLTKYYAYDGFDVDALIQDGTYNRRYEVHILRSSGTPVLYFEINPGTGSLTLTYRKLLSTILDLGTWPEDIGVKMALKKYASYLLCSNTPELQGAGANYKAMAEEQKDNLWKTFRMHSSRPDNRTAQDVWGQGLYQEYAGDTL